MLGVEQKPRGMIIITYSLELVPADLTKYTGSLFSSHHTYPRVRPHVEESGAISTSTHSIVTRSETAAHYHSYLGYFGTRNSRHKFSSILGNTSRFVLLIEGGG